VARATGEIAAVALIRAECLVVAGAILPHPGTEAPVAIAAENTTPRLRAEGRAADFLAADQAEAASEALAEDLPMADTITTNDFHPASPLTSLTVRRLRKEPPVFSRTGEGRRIGHDENQLAVDAANKSFEVGVKSIGTPGPQD
jgi:hypothetical protein